MKIFTVCFTEGWGAEFNLSCQTQSFSFLSCFHGVANVVEVWSWSWCGVTHSRVCDSALIHAVLPCLPARGTEPRPLCGPKVMETPTLGCLGMMGTSQCRRWLTVLGSSWSFETGQWAHVKSLVATSLSMNPPCCPLPWALFCRGAAASVLPLFFLSSFTHKLHLILLEEEIY